MSTICFDFGNTRLKYAVVRDTHTTATEDRITSAPVRVSRTGTSEILEEATLENDSTETLKAILEKYHPAKTILSSVINHNPEIETLFAERTSFHKLSYQSKLPFTTPIAKPTTIGPDRLALCAAAVHLFPGKNNLVIGLGSAITYNFVNKYRAFIGGSISPGMDMRFKSLKDYTAKLPLVKEDWNFPLMGYDTETNILSGVLLGMAKEIDGIMNAYKAKYDNLKVLLTGGNARYFLPHLLSSRMSPGGDAAPIYIDEQLIFKGLYAISDCN